MDSLLVAIGPAVAPVAAFLAFILAGVAVYLLGAYRAEEVRRRMQKIQAPAAPVTVRGGKAQAQPQKEGEFLVRVLQPAGGLILPQKEWRRSMLRSQLVFAGYRDTRALYIYLGAKLLLAVLLPLVVAAGAVLSGNWLFLFQTWGYVSLSLAAGIGFVLPDQVLRVRTKQRRREFLEGFPDAMDMMVVCVEAGLGLDAAVQRVSKELRHSHPALASELALHGLEVRAGKSRQEAFRALAERMNIDQVHALSTILIQAERYGTSVATALRNFAEDMRVERIQRARETAAKLPVKMIFPIVMFIFPALFLVLLGPAVVMMATTSF